MKIFDTSGVDKIIWNLGELSENKMIKLKSKFKNKYEPYMWKIYPNLDCEFIEKIKEKNMEILMGNFKEKNTFLVDLGNSERIY